MKRILTCTTSDFGQENTQMELKKAILASEGRTILVNLAAENTPLYPEVTNAEMAAAFGADLLLLKNFDVQEMRIGGLGVIGSIDTLRQLTGTGIGVNLEIADNIPAFKQASPTSIKEILKKNIAFLSLTAYVKPEATPERIVADIKETRKQYQGFLMLNPVVNHGKNLKLENIKKYVEAGVDMIVLPCPGSVPGVTEEQVATIINSFEQGEVLFSCTVGTSQEGTDKETIQHLALSAKRAGADVFELGDAGVAGMPTPESIYQASIAIRGKRHTFVRMARSANR